MDRLPKGWVIKKLKEISNITGGKRLPRGQQLISEDSGHPYIRVSDMDAEGINLGSILYVPREIAPSIKRYRVNTDDLYFSVAGTIGLVGAIPPQLNGANLTENADRISDISADKDFLLQVLRSELIQTQSGLSSTQNAQPKLALERLRNFDIPYPPLAEQRKIAAILGTWDAAIATVEQLIAALQTRKQGLMQRLLTGEVRFPEFAGSEWDEVTLNDLISSSVSSEWGDEPDESPQTIPVLRSTNFTDTGHLDLEKIARRNIPEARRSKLLLRPGDILLEKSGGSTDRPVGRVVYYDAKDDYVFANFLQRLVVDQKYNQKAVFYVFYQLYQDGRTARYQQRTTGISNLKIDEFLKSPIVFPNNRDEQDQITQALDTADQIVLLSEQYRTKLISQKQALMQQLLTGQVRVKVGDDLATNIPEKSLQIPS